MNRRYSTIYVNLKAYANLNKTSGYNIAWFEHLPRLLLASELPFKETNQAHISSYIVTHFRSRLNCTTTPIQYENRT